VWINWLADGPACPSPSATSAVAFPQIIAHAVWLYFRFPLSLRLVEEMLFGRGMIVSYETIHRWAGNSDPIWLGTSVANSRARLTFGTWSFQSTISCGAAMVSSPRTTEVKRRASERLP
jgi:hypothetical protein